MEHLPKKQEQNALQVTRLKQAKQVQLIIQQLPAEAKKPLTLAHNKDEEKIGEYKKYQGLRYNDRVKYADEWLLQLCYFVGIDPAPELELRVMVIEYMVENYPFLSLSEIKYAFQIALAGKLEIKPESLQHYNKLTATWITTILNAYQKFLNKFKTEYLQKESRIKEEQRSTEEITQEEKDHIMRQGLMHLYQTFLKKEEWHDINGSCYDWGVRNFVIPKASAEIWAGTYENAKDQILAELNGKRAVTSSLSHAKELEQAAKKLTESLEQSAPAVIRTKKILLTTFFTTLRDNNKSLVELLKPIV